MSHATTVAKEFKDDLIQYDFEYRESIAKSLRKHTPNSREEFPLIIQTALRVGIKIEAIAEVAMTPVYNVKRWMNGTHCPPMLVRKTVIDSVSTILQKP